VIFGGTLFFVARAVWQNWQAVINIQLTATTWAYLCMALGITLLAHIWSGWVWSWILAACNQPSSGVWSVQVYLQTNIAKYLPGNIWHFYGRIRAVQSLGIATDTAILSVVIEPVLMAVAALALALLSGLQLGNDWTLAALAGLLIGLHPRVLNPLLTRLGRAKGRLQGALTLRQYPWKPLIGELGFLGLRNLGFLLTVLALQPLTHAQVPVLVGAFSLAWLLGLVIPGAPGGLGVFEATAIALLENTFEPGLILSSVAFYRLISTLAEVGGAGLAWLDERTTQPIQARLSQPDRSEPSLEPIVPTPEGPHH
jgi:hypothetical protein